MAQRMRGRLKTPFYGIDHNPTGSLSGNNAWRFDFHVFLHDFYRLDWFDPESTISTSRIYRRHEPLFGQIILKKVKKVQISFIILCVT